MKKEEEKTFVFINQTADPRLSAIGIHTDNYKFDYEKITDTLNELIRAGCEGEAIEIIRTFSQVDFFFFCYFVLDLPVNHPFLIARCYEIQKAHHLTIDLWAREHWKSSLLTYAMSIWEIIQNKEERIAIFSHTRVLAKSHLRRIKQALEKNQLLLAAFPDIFYARPDKEAPKWSEDEGLYVKRHKNYAEASFESWGLVDSSPIGKHFSVMIFDDLITPRYVTSGEQVRKATEAFQVAQNLGTRRGRKRIIGTRYSNKDTYADILKNRFWQARIYPGEVDEEGKRKREGIPVYISAEELQEKYELQGEYIYSAQILQDPTAESMQGFKEPWLKYWSDKKPYLNLYITIDPASTKKKSSDYTVMAVIGTDHLRNYWLVDMVRDKLDLGERWRKLRDLVQTWGVKQVGCEAYGLNSDIEYYTQMMQEEGVYFNIVELKGQVAKTDRIKRLVPLFQKARFIIPKALSYLDIKDEWHDLTQEFLEEEYLAFPFGAHDDMLDAMSRITDGIMGVTFPNRQVDVIADLVANDPLNIYTQSTIGNWMTT